MGRHVFGDHAVAYPGVVANGYTLLATPGKEVFVVLLRHTLHDRPVGAVVQRGALHGVKAGVDTLQCGNTQAQSAGQVVGSSGGQWQGSQPRAQCARWPPSQVSITMGVPTWVMRTRSTSARRP